MEAILAAIVNNGLSTVISAVFLFFVIHYYQKIDPKLQSVLDESKKKQTTENELKKIAEDSVAALRKSAEADEALAQALTALNSTIAMLETTIGYQKDTLVEQRDLLLLLYADQKETELRLHDLDKRFEKLYTMVHRIYCASFSDDTTCEIKED